MFCYIISATMKRCERLYAHQQINLRQDLPHFPRNTFFLPTFILDFWGRDKILGFTSFHPQKCRVLRITPKLLISRRFGATVTGMTIALGGPSPEGVPSWYARLVPNHEAIHPSLPTDRPNLFDLCFQPLSVGNDSHYISHDLTYPYCRNYTNRAEQRQMYASSFLPLN
jgi:hypothetical protein